MPKSLGTRDSFNDGIDSFTAQTRRGWIPVTSTGMREERKARARGLPPSGARTPLPTGVETPPPHLTTRGSAESHSSAKTTSVLAAGKIPRLGIMPGTDGRSPGSQLSAPTGATFPVAPDRASGSASPSRLPVVKRRTIRRNRGVLPRLITMHFQWLFRHLLRLARPRNARPSAQRRTCRTEDPDCSTVAGSAVMKAPGLGPPRHIPFSSGRRKPIRNHPLCGFMVRRAQPPCQLPADAPKPFISTYTTKIIEFIQKLTS